MHGHLVVVVAQVLRRGGHLVPALGADVALRVGGAGRRHHVGVEHLAVEVGQRLLGVAASSTSTHCQACRFEPDGACTAMAMHSSTTERSTGRVRSSRLRTARVVVSSSSGVRGSRSAMAVVYHRPVAVGSDRHRAVGYRRRRGRSRGLTALRPHAPPRRPGALLRSDRADHCDGRPSCGPRSKRPSCRPCCRRWSTSPGTPACSATTCGSTPR